MRPVASTAQFMTIVGIRLDCQILRRHKATISQIVQLAEIMFPLTSFRRHVDAFVGHPPPAGCGNIAVDA